jgi:hypothetical protein
MISNIIKDLEQECNRKLNLKELALIKYIYDQGKKDGKAEQKSELINILNK